MTSDPATAEETPAEASPVLRIVTRLLSKERESGRSIPPKEWILELLDGMKEQLGTAGLAFEGHRGPAGCAFLRDPLAGTGSDQRPITRFHAARGFLEESIALASDALDRNPGDAQIKKKSAMRRQLYDWLVEAESLYEQQHDPSARAKAVRSDPKPVREAAPAAVPLSFPNETQREEAKANMRQLATDQGADAAMAKTLGALRESLCRLEPEVTDLVGKTLGDARTLDGAVCSVFAVMSEAGVSSFERAWLSELGSYLVELKGELAAAAPAPKATPAPQSAAAKVEQPPAAKAPAAKAVEPEKPKSPPEPKPAPVPKAASAESTPAPEPKPSPDPKPDIQTGPVRKPAPRSGLTPAARRELKLGMMEAFKGWENADAAWNERRCLHHLSERMIEQGMDQRLVDSLTANRFLQARENVEAVDAETPQDQKLKRQGTMLLQDVQTAYFQRLRELLGIEFFVEPTLRASTLEGFTQGWKTAFDDAEGKAETRVKMADQQTLTALGKRLGEEGLNERCSAFLAEHLEKADSIEGLWMHLIKAEPSDPLTGLFRAQLKGFVEDIDLGRAFLQGRKDGWLAIIGILAHEHPVSESELTAMLARKVAAMGGTQAHENFLNPTRNLRLSNFLNWVQHGYLMSPNYTDSPEEKAIVTHLSWILQQLVGLAEMAEEGHDLDRFLADEGRSQYAVYATYLGEVARRFETWHRDWRQANTTS